MSETFTLVVAYDEPRDLSYMITEAGPITAIHRSRYLPAGTTILLNEERIKDSMEAVLSV